MVNRRSTNRIRMSHESRSHIHKRLMVSWLFCWVLMVVGGCGESAERATTTGDQVLILAAVSTQDALEQVAAVLQAQGSPRLTISPAGSNALAQQIIAGSPGDLFLSANPMWANEVARHGHAAETAQLLSGQLVLVVPADNPANIHQPGDLLGDQVRRLALAGEQVPAGMYAQQALQMRKLYEPLLDSGRIVRGQNVRFTLAYVQRGEAEAGIVYAGDAAAAPNVQAVYTFDAKDHEPMVYPLVLLAHGQDRPAVREVFAFLKSPQAGAIFEQFGFRPLISPAEKAPVAR